MYLKIKQTFFVGSGWTAGRVTAFGSRTSIPESYFTNWLIASSFNSGTICGIFAIGAESTPAVAAKLSSSNSDSFLSSSELWEL